VCFGQHHGATCTSGFGAAIKKIIFRLASQSFMLVRICTCISFGVCAQPVGDMSKAFRAFEESIVWLGVLHRWAQVLPAQTMLQSVCLAVCLSKLKLSHKPSSWEQERTTTWCPSPSVLQICQPFVAVCVMLLLLF
jgi:hypothetical protein